MTLAEMIEISIKIVPSEEDGTVITRFTKYLDQHSSREVHDFYEDINNQKIGYGMVLMLMLIIKYGYPSDLNAIADGEVIL